MEELLSRARMLMWRLPFFGLAGLRDFARFRFFFPRNFLCDRDSLRYEIGSNSSSNTYPPYIEILIDSAGLEKDLNGVFTFVPNYDIGLPESGLLIWHIDEAIINDGLFSYSINSDLLYRGVDLEEADGAQDIGYVSLDIFNDPTSGWFGDMWYKGNSQYMFANPNMDGLAPLFGPETYPY